MSRKILFLPVMIYLILLSCAIPEEPVGPIWNLKITNIPLLKADTVEVGEELVGDNIQPDENYLLHMNFTDTTEFNVEGPLILIPGIEVPLTNIEQELFEEPPEGLENLQFDQVNIIIRSLNIPFGFLLHLDFTATKKGELHELSREIVIPGGDIAPHSVNIAELINIMPEKISINGWISVLENVTITESVEYNIEYALDVPLRFSLTENTYIEKIDELGLDEDAKDVIDKNLISASLEGTIINDTPISGSIEFYVGQDSSAAGTPNLLFELTLPVRGSEGAIYLSIDRTKLDYLLDANYYRVYVTVNSVLDAELNSTDLIIIKDIYLSGEAKIDIEEMMEEDEDEENHLEY